ncbi:MAG: ImcF-related family protein [Neisseria zoodegmatis]|uniref:ImcF-related family protein n=1 Tax=Neisseria zoodegmatis TaxID=326523 RepID=UPI0026EF2892|nr:ImcF-related family protein [Neisseria zoodegmatis]MDO5068839.1 ImcF-related family protein [Neisseria zoodegmatis]
MRPLFLGLILLVISILSGCLVYFFGSKIGLEGSMQKTVVWMCLVVITSLIFLMPMIIRYVWSGWSGRYAGARKLITEELKEEPSESIRLLGNVQRWEQLQQIYTLTTQYKNHRKPWIFVDGSDEVVLQVFPEIKTHLWVESHSAFWIDLHAPEPLEGWNGLRGQGVQPAEGIVYLSDEINSAEQFSGAIKSFMDKLGWLLPVNMVYVDRNHQHTQPYSVTHRVLETKQENIQKDLDRFAFELSGIGTFSIEEKPTSAAAALLSRKLQVSNGIIAEKLALNKKEMGKSDSLNTVAFVHARQQDLLPDLIYQSFNSIADFNKGKKLKWTQPDKIYGGLSILAVLATVGFSMAAYNSHKDMATLQQSIMQLKQNSSSINNLADIIKLQKQITYLEEKKASTSGKILTAVGYNHSKELLDTAYLEYGKAVKAAVVSPVLQKWTDHLSYLDGYNSASIENGDEYYNILKAYLMVTDRTDKVDPQFLASNMLLIFDGYLTKNDQVKEVVAFYTQRLAQHQSWASQSDALLVDNTRQVLAKWMGDVQTEEHVYRKIIEEGNQKFPSISLAEILKRDIQNEWVVAKKLPGVFTVEAWNKYIEPAFQTASKNNHEDDWVLAGKLSAAEVNEIAIKTLKDKYFSEYAAAWFEMLNSISWVSRNKSLEAVNQLHVYADPQRSPLVALMDVIKENSMIDAKRISVNQAVLNKAEKIAAAKVSTRQRQLAAAALESQSEEVKAVQEQVQDYLQGPLHDQFATLLQLIDANVNPKSDLSLQRYLEKVTATKQRLIQIVGSSDTGGAARIAVQGVMSGEQNEFTDGLQYARLVEAGVGDKLMAFANNVFVKPFHVSWGSLSGVAQENINSVWHQNVMSAAEADMGGKYPLNTSEIEVAIPVLAKYFEPNKGNFDQFIQSQLKGILTKQGHRWVEVPGQEFKVNREFLNQINKLGLIANDLFVNGEVGYTFELKPAPTAGITSFSLMLDGQSLNYFNQEAEWKAFRWPGDVNASGAQITWESDVSGVRKNIEFNGRFGFIRLLDKARVTPIDSGTYLVESEVDNNLAIRFYIRTNTGKGPLGLLEMRNVHIPNRIFEVSAK